MRSRAEEIANAICNKAVNKATADISIDALFAFRASIIEEVEPLIVELEAVRAELTELKETISNRCL